MSTTSHPFESTLARSRPLAFVDIVLRGVGQVMFQENAYTGALFLVGIFYNSALFGLAALAGTIASTLTALVLGFDRQLVQAGLFGFNGTLVGIAIVLFLEPNGFAWGYLVAAAAFSSVLMAALARFWSRWGMPALTAPFVFTGWIFLLGAGSFGRLVPTGLPAASFPVALDEPGLLAAATIFEGLFKGVGQVFFQDNVITGIIFLIALFVGSRRASLAALLGSLVGLLVAFSLGAAEPEMRAGLFGFNSVLTAIAMGGTFHALDRRTMPLALLGAVASAVVFATLARALQPLGLVPLTAPFVLVVWASLLALPRVSPGEPQASDG